MVLYSLEQDECEGDNWVAGLVDLTVRKIPQNSPHPSISVAIGSVIYIICGHNYHEPNIIRVYYLDTSNPEHEWLEGSFLNVGGVIGSAVVHEGKIYVFGRFGKQRNPCYGLVYDPVLDSWEPLSDPPTVLGNLQGKFVRSYDDKKILVHPCMMKTLYAYDVVDKSWEVFDRDFGFWHCRGVIMDDILYAFHSRRVEIYGYDLVRLKWLKPINLDNLEWFLMTKNSDGTELHEAYFFIVEANVLCLVYFDQMGREGLDIYLKTFTIGKIMQGDGDAGFDVQVFSSTIYKLREEDHCLDYVVA